MSDHFIQIQCPSCGSTEVEVVNAPTYRCRHCSSSFIFRDPRPQAAPPQAPPPPRYAPSPYGPSPYGHQQPQIVIATHSGGAGRWIVWMIVMLFIFGGSGISAFLAFFRAAGTSTTTSSTTTTPTATPAKTATSTTKTVTPVPAIAPAATPTPAPEPDDVDPAAEPPTVAAVAEVDLGEYESLSGCGCRTDVDGDGRKDQIDLYYQAASSTVITSGATDHFIDLKFAIAGEGVKPFNLPTTEETAPQTRYKAGRFGLGVGCEGDTMVVAALDRVAGWSLAKKELRWSRTLTPAFSRFAEGKAAVDCSTIPVSAGIAKVRTESGTQSLRLDTGNDADRASSASSARATSSASSSSSTRPSSTPKTEPPSKPETKPETKPEKKVIPPIPPKTKTEPRKPKQPDADADAKKKGKKGKKAG